VYLHCSVDAYARSACICHFKAYLEWISVNHVGKEAGYRFSRFAISIALALAFWGAGLLVPSLFKDLSEFGRLLTWVTLTLVAGIFLVRALSDGLVLGDKAIGFFMSLLGVKERPSRRRILKDFLFIVAILLAAAAVSPFYGDLGSVGNGLQVLTTYVTLGAILLFVYDLGRTFYRIAEEKVNLLTDWLTQPNNEEVE
jgi:hypothetical protein